MPARSYIDRANSFALVGLAVKRSIAVSRAVKDRGKEADTGVLSIEIGATCAISTTSLVLTQYSTHGGAVLWGGSHDRCYVH